MTSYDRHLRFPNVITLTIDIECFCFGDVLGRIFPNVTHLHILGFDLCGCAAYFTSLVSLTVGVGVDLLNPDSHEQTHLQHVKYLNLPMSTEIPPALILHPECVIVRKQSAPLP